MIAVQERTTFAQQRTTEKRFIRRSKAVALTTVAAVAVWGGIELGGLDLRSPAFQAGGEGFDIGLGSVLFTSGVASLAGWGLLALLERATRRARMLWTVLAIAGFVVSLSGPLSGTGISAAGRLGLAMLHVVVAAVLILLMRQTLPPTE